MPEEDKKKEGTPEPRWNIITEMYNGFDKVLGEREEDKDLTFFEIQASILMLTEKVNQEKLNMYLQYLKDEKTTPTPDNMYK
tara:strand:+ start:271 stop:516 length:246 start_codon:yes stop_codon:yes gene_type:complete